MCQCFLVPPEPPIAYIIGLMGTAAVLILGLAFLCCCLCKYSPCFRSIMLFSYWVAVSCIICEHLSSILWRIASICRINKKLKLCYPTQHFNVISQYYIFWFAWTIIRQFVYNIKKNSVSIICLYIYFVS